MTNGMKMYMLANRGDGSDMERAGRSRENTQKDSQRDPNRGYQPQDMNNAYAMNNYYEPIEDRRARRDSRGRYAPRNEMDMEMRSGGGGSNVYRMEDMRSHYPMHTEPKPMRKIGFEMGGELDSNYRTSAEYSPSYEMEHKMDPYVERGKAHGSMDKLTMEMAEEWMEALQNETEVKDLPSDTEDTEIFSPALSGEDAQRIADMDIWN